ncbi:TetR/AcrR family transcriptional regulator [Neorhizobium lilium]|uniref:TetR/AcrR family transcriptional regulator n=1 Tax=Neorhizobium lilium TaxID=2503024 RepID=A0A3S3RLI0_9HYPH|nr:TetR family transcriptional regulator [Neorhizobium lilium]RWX79256.1 TetR/AcrR family transcriptional regulator [Neorhizobium lilium]
MTQEQVAEAARRENVCRILDAAERLFKHYGYAKTNVADIARDLGMSSANIYRFFSSKTDIHHALAHRMMEASYQAAVSVADRKASASERLKDFTLSQFKITVDTMLDEKKVHEMVVVAIEQNWPVIEAHIERLRLLVERMITEGIAAGEFREQEPALAAECFMSATVILCHPQLVAKCLAKSRISTPEDLIEFGLRALK